MMEWRNAQFNATGGIDLEANHPRFGWIPMTCAATDEATAALFAAAEGEAAAYVAPPEPEPPTPEQALAAERAAMVCSPAQMRLTLLAGGQLATVQAIADGDAAASILWEYATQFKRTSPLIDALGGPNGFTPEQIDDLFRAAMAVDI